MNGQPGFSTRAIHTGGLDDPYHALTPPIYQTSTFAFESCVQGAGRFDGSEEGYVYSRMANPTIRLLEERISALECCEDTVAFASGMGAISAVVWTACQSGAHIVAHCTLYGCTYSLLKNELTRYGVEVSFVSLTNAENLRQTLRDNTALVYVESPVNPNLDIVDLREVSRIAHEYNRDIRVVCDNTFATPYLQRPVACGCDVVVHSATKYLNGHGDVIAGFACGGGNFMREVRGRGRKDITGAVLGPFDAFLIMRGLKTLALRMERHCDNTEILAKFLKNHPKVSRVYYPGLLDHPNHDIAKKQMQRFGAMVSFELNGGREAGLRLLDSIKLCAIAVSLGDAETLLEHPATMTHSGYSPGELAAAGIPAGLIRISAGLEDAKDIIADIEQAFQ